MVRNYRHPFRPGRASVLYGLSGLRVSRRCSHAHRRALSCRVSREAVQRQAGRLGNLSRAAFVRHHGLRNTGLSGRGVLLDIPRLRGVKWLEPGEAVTAEELEAAEKAQNVRLREGDILVFRTGHHRRRLELGPWDNTYKGEGKAGLHSTTMRLLHERRVAAFLPDGDGETVPSNVEGVAYPVHALQIAAMGMACCRQSAVRRVGSDMRDGAAMGVHGRGSSVAASRRYRFAVQPNRHFLRLMSCGSGTCFSSRMFLVFGQ